MITLLELDPDFAALLSDEERAVAGRLGVAVHTVDAEDDVAALLGETGAFGAEVLEGMLVRRLRVGDQVGIRLLGAGDIVMAPRDVRSVCLAESQLIACQGARLALFGEGVLFGLRRWPTLALRLLERFAERVELLEAQLVISQLPRVDQRVSAVMWLLAERWGRVTRMGTHLPIHLTHDTLGALIGARRSTVTLALGQLADHGEVIKQEDGWLLLAPPPQPSGLSADTSLEGLKLRAPSPTPWMEQALPDNGSPPIVVAFSGAVRADCREERALAGSHRDRARKLRARSRELRWRSARAQPSTEALQPFRAAR